MSTNSNDERKQRGFKPGANMPHDDYDPLTEGMSESGNHAVGHPGNDTPHVNQQSDQHGRQPARSEQGMRQDGMSRSYSHSRQDAAAASAATTHRYNAAGARADNNSGKGR